MDVDRSVHAYYERGEEIDRLDAPHGRLELLRTCELIERHVPPETGVVADVGGGPGRYAEWLVGRGHRVIHRDPVPLHVDQTRDRFDRSAGRDRIDTAVGDARELDLPDGSVDATLLLGPLYHLPDRADRIRALAEAGRVTRSGGPILVAAISRWAPRLHSVLCDRLYLVEADIVERLDELESTGFIPPLFDSSFTGYTHRPDELAEEVRAAGLALVDLVNVEGPAGLLPDLGERLTDPVDRDIVLGTARAAERVPELLGVGPHLLAVATAP